METYNLKTKCGEIKGIDKGETLLFKGIKYASAKRYEYPVKTTSWEGTYDATEYGSCSFQRRAFEDDVTCNAFYHKEFRKGLSFKYSEDCLFLNIWAPKDKTDCPVIIYIHGGSFTGGSTDEGHIDGETFAKNGVIFVAMNYRLGPFGFCSHPDVSIDGVCGNFGLYDQLAAIEWIRDNISSFGGDVSKITVLGQSAGAMSVDILVSSPLCKGYFQGAVLMSGAAMQRAIARPVSPEKTRKFWDNIISKAGVSSIEELKTVDEKTLFYAWSDACKEDKLSMLYTLPVVDGKLVTKETFKMSNVPDIPYIVGVTITDMLPVGLELLAKKFAKRTKKNSSPCYVYNFNRLLPGDNHGAWHSADLLYAFSTLDFNWRPFEEIDYTISNQMCKMLCAFANNGNPNCPEIPKWDGFPALPMRFCEDTKPMPWETKTLFHNTFHNQGAEF